MLESFHFLRPLWLLALLPTALLLWLLLRQSSAALQWRSLVAPHLLEHLLVRSERRQRLRPLGMLALILVFGIVAAAGPSWRREPTPFTEDNAALVIALDLDETMLAIDVQPTRLERAQHKIHDLLALRAGARTGLLAYAGSAHMVMPLTDDANILQQYLEALRPELMPVAGKNAPDALELAERMLALETAPGSILFVTDGIAEDQVDAFVTHSENSRNSVLVLAVGTREGGPLRAGDDEFLTDTSGAVRRSALDWDGLQSLAERADIPLTSSTVDDKDVRRLASRVERDFQSAQSEDESQRWRDDGYALVIPIGVLALLWARRGWLVQWR